MPTEPLMSAKYLAPFTPNELLNTTGNGSPDFCDKFPDKLTIMYTKKEPMRLPNKTIKKSKS